MGKSTYSVAGERVRQDAERSGLSKHTLRYILTYDNPRRWNTSLDFFVDDRQDETTGGEKTCFIVFAGGDVVPGRLVRSFQVIHRSR